MKTRKENQKERLIELIVLHKQLLTLSIKLQLYLEEYSSDYELQLVLMRTQWKINRTSSLIEMRIANDQLWSQNL